MKTICPNCNKEAPWIPNEQVYGKRYGKSYMCYWCKDCDYYVGCHENTRRALGTMVGKELRQLRMKVHRKIDPLWQTGKINRKALYRKIANALGKNVYHTAEANEEDCRAVLELNLTEKSLFDKLPKVF